MTHSSAIRKRAYHHGNLQQVLLRAARQLLEEGGEPALTLRAAAQLAGVSATATYRHYRDREALLAAVLAQGFDELALVTARARDLAPDPVQAYLAVGRSYVGFAAAHPQLYRLMFGATCNKLAHPALVEAGRGAFGVVLQAAKRCAELGLLGTREAGDAALAGWAMVHGLASLHTDGVLGLITQRTLDDMGDALLSVLVEGIAPR